MGHSFAAGGSGGGEFRGGSEMDDRDRYEAHATTIRDLIGQDYETECQSEPISNTDAVHLVVVRLKQQPDPDKPVWYNIYYGPDNALDTENGYISRGWVCIKCDGGGELQEYESQELPDLLADAGLISN